MLMRNTQQLMNKFCLRLKLVKADGLKKTKDAEDGPRT